MNKGEKVERMEKFVGTREGYILVDVPKDEEACKGCIHEDLEVCGMVSMGGCGLNQRWEKE